MFQDIHDPHCVRTGGYFSSLFHTCRNQDLKMRWACSNHPHPLQSDSCLLRLPNGLCLQSQETAFHSRKQSNIETTPQIWKSLCWVSGSQTITTYKLHSLGGNGVICLFYSHKVSTICRCSLAVEHQSSHETTLTCTTSFQSHPCQTGKNLKCQKTAQGQSFTLSTLLSVDPHRGSKKKPISVFQRPGLCHFHWTQWCPQCGVNTACMN